MTDRIRPDTGAEAPASLNLRFHYAGYDVQLTLRDEAGSILLDKLDPVLDRLRVMGAAPVGSMPYNGGEAAAAGNGKGGEPTTAARGNGDGTGGGHICPTHNVAMRAYSRNGHTWHSHRLPSGLWCKGKVAEGAG